MPVACASSRRFGFSTIGAAIADMIAALGIDDDEAPASRAARDDFGAMPSVSTPLA